MFLSYRWLNEFIRIDDIDPHEIGHRLTMCTSEIETIEEVGGNLDKVVIGKILEVKPHPDSDHLFLTKTDVGGETLDIVSGALTKGELVEGLVETSSYGLFGFSRGGGAAVLHAGANPSVVSLVTWAAISHVNRWDPDTVAEWRSSGMRKPPGDDNGEDLVFYTDMLDDIANNAKALDIAGAASRVEAPWLILHGKVDDFVPVSEGEQLHRAANRAKVSLRVVENGNHTFSAVGQLEYAMDQTLAWFSSRSG